MVPEDKKPTDSASPKQSEARTSTVSTSTQQARDTDSRIDISESVDASGTDDGDFI